MSNQAYPEESEYIYGVRKFEIDTSPAAGFTSRPELTLLLFFRGSSHELIWRDHEGNERRQEKFAAPCVAVIAESIHHHMWSEGDAEILGLAVDPTFAEEVIRRQVTGVTFAAFAQLNCCDLTISRLAEEHRPAVADATQPETRYMRASLDVVGARILKVLFGEEEIEAIPGELPAAAQQKMDFYIHSHINERYAPDAMAAAAGYSTGYFQKLVWTKHHMTPYQYMRYCQVQRAEVDVRTKTDRIIDIAGRYGFEDDSSLMAYWFRRFLNQTPREIRNEIRAKFEAQNGKRVNRAKLHGKSGRR